MKSNLTVLNNNKKTNLTLKETLTKLLEQLDESQGEVTLYAGLVVIDTSEGLGFFNLKENDMISLIGLLEVGKTVLIEEMGNPDSDFIK